MTIRIKFWCGKRSGWIVLLAAGLLLLGCARTAVISYYQLSAINRESTAIVTDHKAETAVIGIGPVLLPEYLERPQIITRPGANRLQLADGHRWAEPLAENITWVLKENLALLLENVSLHSYPWQQSANIDRQLTIDIIHFEGDGNSSAQLVLVWTIKNGKGEVLLPQKRSNFQVTYSSLNYSGLTGALSETLSLFCREVAEELKSLPD